MTHEDFNRTITEQTNFCLELLVTKGKEYAGENEDRLHTFKRAARLQEVSQPEALIGMFTKHVISIYDMAKNSTAYSRKLWDEKITDAINYLLLLKTVIVEEEAKHGAVQ